MKVNKFFKGEYLILFLILSFSAFFRLFRLNLLLGFWYDQGRDALVIWDLLHLHKFFLIGPVTGIEGIFLGPFYYYLLAPFYWVGKGNPVTAAAAIGWMNVGAVFLIYYLGKQVFNKNVGLLAAFIYGFSYSNVTFSRWLANPAPLPFFTLLVLIFLYKFIQSRNSRFLILSSFLVGLCLQLEAASAVWFLPATLVIIFLGRKNITRKHLCWVLLALFTTFLPQIYFNFRHGGILVTAFEKFLITERSFSTSLWQTARSRLLLYYDIFCGKLIPGFELGKIAVLTLFSATMLIFKEKVSNQGGKILMVWLIVPLVGFFFYQGNHGYIWDYYFTGAMPAFFILFSAGLAFLWKKNLIGKILMSSFLIVFMSINIRSLKNYSQSGVGITLRAQKKAIDWVYHDAEQEDFNVDVYVPPQIYYAYSYLFRWYGESKHGREPETRLVKSLYTIEEPDGEHPQFLAAWLKRQETIGKIIKEYSWGDITVQKRERIKYE